jgi:hypothetical protein
VGRRAHTLTLQYLRLLLRVVRGEADFGHVKRGGLFLCRSRRRSRRRSLRRSLRGLRAAKETRGYRLEHIPCHAPPHDLAQAPGQHDYRSTTSVASIVKKIGL